MNIESSFSLQEEEEDSFDDEEEDVTWSEEQQDSCKNGEVENDIPGSLVEAVTGLAEDPDSSGGWASKERTPQRVEIAVNEWIGVNSSSATITATAEELDDSIVLFKF